MKSYRLIISKFDDHYGWFENLYMVEENGRIYFEEDIIFP